MNKLKIASILATLGVTGLLSVCGIAAPSGASTSKVNVVAGENFWGSIVSQIGGRYANVTSIITDPNTDPHEYTSSAADVGAVSNANLVIENGLSYDNWLPPEVPGGATQIVVANVLHVPDNAASESNPHLWYDTYRMPVVAASFTRSLCKLAPAHCSYFKVNEAKFDASLKPILAVEAAVKAKYAGTPVLYTEPVPLFFIDQMGLKPLTPLGFAASIQAGTEPSARDQLTESGDLTNHKVKLLFYNIQTVSPVTTQIQQDARKAGVPIVGVSETLQPKGNTYQKWQLAEVKATLKALGG